MTDKRWVTCTICFLCAGLLAAASATACIDPFFHFHAPLKGLSYPINNERYQNDGIVRHFTYDAVITGTSMTENFKTSEFDDLFQVCSVKVPFSGGSYKEINDNLTRALSYNPSIRYVVRGLDYSMLLQDKDQMRTDVEYPVYLYDDLWWNDTAYLFNKEILFTNTKNVLSHTRSGKATTDFDSYANWNSAHTFGKESVDKTYQRTDKKEETAAEFTEEDRLRLEEQITQNVTSLAAAYPETQFYYFFTPYSIYYWDSQLRAGTLNRLLDAEQAAIEMILEYENIHLFSFTDQFDIVCNLDNYKDVAHYGEWINSWMLEQMKEEKHRLTKENYMDYCRKIREFYSSYDYDQYFTASFPST